jgi:tetratricopeptide (TPR) repeat protein
VVLLLPALLALAWLLPKALAPDAYGNRDFGMAERLMTEPRVVLDYLRWTIAPNLREFGLFHDDYPVTRSFAASPWSALSVLLLAAIAAGSALLRTRRPLAGLGLAWFLAAQLLTATFIPLELVFEHRNYFASAGVCLVLLDLLLLLPTRAGWRRFGLAVAVLLLVGHGATTRQRVQDWSDPFTFARSEALRHPQSPRATYGYAQAMALASDGRAGSELTQSTFAAYERAMALPQAGISPAQGALLLAARTGAPMREAWWRDMQSRLRSRPIGPQDLGSLGTLTMCAVNRQCRFPPDEMLATYAAALSRGDHPEVLSVYGNYAYNVLRDAPLAERLWREARRLDPGQPEYRVTLAKLMLAQGRFDEAEREIRALDSMGRMGQHHEAAAALEQRLRDERRIRAPLR